MTTAATTDLGSALTPVARLRERLSMYGELAKSRLSLLVVLTAAVGYVMAAPADIDWWALAAVAAGVMLAASAANALNQWLEIERDRCMSRTRNRPLPSGRMSVTHAIGFATVCGVAGVALLWWVNGYLAATLAAANIALYVAVYTPLKVRSTMNTVVGAVVGAIPPMIGWAAATGRLGAGAWVLAAVLFAWQMPHFLALAWMYREQYEAGGFRMLPAVDPTGRLTAAAAMLYSLALLPAAVTMTLLGHAGWWYAAGAGLLGLWLIHGAWRLAGDRSRANARRLFLASVAYLPLLLGLMVVDRAGHDPVDEPTTRAAHVQPETAEAL